MIGSDGGYFTAFLDQAVAREMYPDINAVTATVLRPAGQTLAVKDGYRVSGRWKLRRCAVVEMVPKDPRHPYSSKVLFWDAQTYRTTIALAFDRAGKLWRVWQPQNSWSEDTVEQPNPDRGTFIARYEGVPTIDLQSRQATLILRPSPARLFYFSGHGIASATRDW